MKPSTCLFDLDGTLTDPKIGITGCIQYALEKLDQQAPTKDELEFAIGPPLYLTFLQLLDNDPEAAAKGVLFYRERFGTIGLFENVVYPGIHDSLSKLKDAGIQLFVATSKPHVYAKRIAEHFEFDHFFDHVHGSEMSGERQDKGELINHILTTEGLEPETTLMIGDRKHDILGAKQCGLRTIGVLYGYGSKDELTEAGADDLADSPEGIVEEIVRK
jgi:phosphoglycolate phosphatase